MAFLVNLTNPIHPRILRAAVRAGAPLGITLEEIGVFEATEFGDAFLMSLSVDLVALCGRAAGHVDRILRGAPAGDLPVEEADGFELVINLNTARTLGLTIPAALLQRAETVS